MISKLITFRITKAEAEVQFGVKYLCRHECEIARYGVFGCLNMANLGCDAPSPFSGHLPLGEMRIPTQKGHLSDTCAIPYENKTEPMRYPPLRYYLERVLRDMGGYLALGR